MKTIPTLSQLRIQIQADIEASFGESTPAFGKVFITVLSGVWAGMIWVLYKFLGFIQKNIFVDTADPESTGGTLERWGRIKLNRNPFPAVAAQYVVNVTGTVGAIIEGKTVFKSNDNSTSPGKLFILDQAFQLLTNPDQITLRALEAGTDSRLNVSDQLTATIPLVLVNQVVTVASESVAPLAAETIEQYRDATILAFQTETQGGAGGDYRVWASDVQGVRTVYPFLAYGGQNEVDVYVEANIDDSTDGKGTPTAQILSDVEDAINLDPDDTKDINERGRRPINVIVNVLPIVIREVVITITGYQNLTSTIQSTILGAIEEMLNDIRPFVAGVDPLSEKNDRLDLNRIISKITEAVPGSVFNSVSMTVSGSNVGSFIFENGDIPHLNSVVYS